MLAELGVTHADSKVKVDELPHNGPRGLCVAQTFFFFELIYTYQPITLDICRPAQSRHFGRFCYQFTYGMALEHC